MKSRFSTTIGNDQFSGWTKKKLQNTSESQTWTERRSWSLFGSRLPFWSTITFWVAVKPLHLRSMLSKLMRYTRNYACSWHWSTEKAWFFSMTTSNYMLHNTSKAERIGLQSFASSAVFTWPLANWLPLPQATWQLFAGKPLPQPAGSRKCFPTVPWILKHRFLCYRNKQT